MTQIEVPEYKGRKFSPMGYKPSKQEVKNLRYWKAKKAIRKPITREEARRVDPDYTFDAIVKKLKEL